MMSELHHRGVELLVDVLDAAEHLERMSMAEIKELLTEIGLVLGQLLERDIPESPREALLKQQRAKTKAHLASEGVVKLGSG